MVTTVVETVARFQLETAARERRGRAMARVLLAELEKFQRAATAEEIEQLVTCRLVVFALEEMRQDDRRRRVEGLARMEEK